MSRKHKNHERNYEPTPKEMAKMVAEDRKYCEEMGIYNNGFAAGKERAKQVIRKKMIDLAAVEVEPGVYKSDGVVTISVKQMEEWLKEV